MGAGNAELERTQGFTRATLVAIWSIAAIALGAWFLLAWGGHALLSDSSAWFSGALDPWIASAAWDARLVTLLSWGESLGTFVVWSVWALGTIGLLLTCTFATLLYARAQRALSAPR
jgi:hypothetical protein